MYVCCANGGEIRFITIRHCICDCFVTASWMYVYTGNNFPSCQPMDQSQPIIVYRNECLMISNDAFSVTWVKHFISRPRIRSLVVTFVGLNTCSPVSSIGVFVRFHDGNYGSCIALWYPQIAEKPGCTFRCHCLASCTDVTIVARGIYQQEIGNVSYRVN